MSMHKLMIELRNCHLDKSGLVACMLFLYYNDLEGSAQALERTENTGTGDTTALCALLHKMSINELQHRFIIYLAEGKLSSAVQALSIAVELTNTAILITQQPPIPHSNCDYAALKEFVDVHTN